MTSQNPILPGTDIKTVPLTNFSSSATVLPNNREGLLAGTPISCLQPAQKTRQVIRWLATMAVILALYRPFSPLTVLMSPVLPLLHKFIPDAMDDGPITLSINSSSPLVTVHLARPAVRVYLKKSMAGCKSKYKRTTDRRGNDVRVIPEPSIN